MMNSIDKINRLAKENPLELIALSEEKYKKEIIKIIDRTLENKHCRILLLAGPSGSGKTTTAHILEEGFKKRGVDAEVVSLDNFYLDVLKVPKLENGQPDFETVYALDIPEIHRCFEELLTNEKTNIPIFDFAKKGRAEYREIDIENHGIIIIEGLHAINPELTKNLPTDSWLSVYISPNCSVIGSDGKKLLSSRMLRLARRMSRDFLYRNTTAAETLKLWTSVTEGEEKYLYCFKSTADILLKTFHSFEPCIFKDIVVKLLENLPLDTENYEYAMKTKNALEQFESLPFSLVPETSLIREFIEGSRF